MDNGRKLGRRQYEPIEDTNTSVVIEEIVEELVAIEKIFELEDETREDEKVGQTAQ